MKFPIVKRSKYEDLKKELDVALEQMKHLETIIKYVDEVCKAWLVGKALKGGFQVMQGMTDLVDGFCLGYG